MANQEKQFRTYHRRHLYCNRLHGRVGKGPNRKSTINLDSRGGLMVSTQVRQSEGSGFKSRTGQIVYFHGVKTTLSTFWTGDVPRGSDFT